MCIFLYSPYALFLNAYLYCSYNMIMYPALIEHVKRYVALNDDEAQILLNFLKPIELKKKDYLLKEGQVCKADYFVANGCLRMFFINEKGTEQTTQFAIENWWIADYMSLDRKIPAPFCIQAVEYSSVIAIDAAVQDQLFKALPQLERYFRVVFQKAYAAAQLRIKYLYGFSKEESYRHFIAQFPEFAQRVPQYMLASYLGFTPEYLSELRNKKA